MSDLAIALHWHRATPALQTGAYSNEHTVQYNNRYDLLVDSAPDWGGNPDNTNPEQALASRRGNAVSAKFHTGFAVSAEDMEQMQDRAHRYCFIANTLADSVEINIL